MGLVITYFTIYLTILHANDSTLNTLFSVFNVLIHGRDKKKKITQ